MALASTPPRRLRRATIRTYVGPSRSVTRTHITCVLRPLLQRISPALRGVDFATTDLRSIATARAEYEALRAERDRVAQVHAAYDAYEYHTIDGEKLNDKSVSKSLDSRVALTLNPN